MAAFDPVSLFSGGEVGVIYDVQTLASMFQDSAGTTPAVVDSPVGRINDLSGGNRHALQTTAGKRPILRSLNGQHYLEFDGVDDFLRAAFTITQPIHRISLLTQLDYTATHLIGGVANAGVLFQNAGNDAQPQLGLYSGAVLAGSTGYRLPLGTKGLVREVHNGASSSVRIGPDTATNSNAGTTAPDGITIGANFADGPGPPMHLYGLVEINRALTATEIDGVEYWLTQAYSRALAVDGDSNSYSPLPPGYAYQYLANASPQVFLHNLAIAGTGFDTSAGNDLVIAARVANIDARVPADKRGRQYVYFPWWSNNFPNGGHYLDPLTPRTPEQVSAAVAVWLQARKTAGWDKVGIGTLIERTDAGQNNSAVRGAYNTIISAPGWIQANGIDFLVDFAAEPIMGAVGASTNTTYFEADAVHIKAAGHALLEVVFRAALNALPMPSTGALGGSTIMRCGDLAPWVH